MTDLPTTVRSYRTAKHLPSIISMAGPTANEVLRLWRTGVDTYDIAKALHLPEHEVSSLLWRIRDVRHRENADA